MATTNVTDLVTAQTPSLLTQIGIAIAIFLIGLILGRIASKLVHKFLEFLGLEDALFKRGKRAFSVHRLISESVALIVYIIFAIIALNYIGITSIILTVLGSVAVIVILASAFLSLRDSIPNMMAYTTIVKEQSFAPGDVIKLDSVTGEIKKITVFEVQVETKIGDVIHIPNRAFVREKYTKKAKKTTEK